MGRKEYNVMDEKLKFMRSPKGETRTVKDRRGELSKV